MARVDYKDMIKFTEEAIVKSKLLEGLDLVPLETYDGMDTRSAWEFKTPMASGFYKPYTLKGSTKIEKITYGELHYMRRAIYSTINFTASDNYDLPVFSVEFDDSATRIGATVDFMPLVDLSLHPEPDRLAQLWQSLYRDSLNKWYVDEVYDRTIVRPTFAGATGLWKRVDVNVIDGAVNGVARAIAWGGWLLRLTQSGQTQHYALGMALGAVVLFTMFFFL